MSATQQQRAVSLLLVLLLHGLLMFAFLHFLVRPQSLGLPAAERLLEFVIPPAKVQPAPARSSSRVRVPLRAQPGGEHAGAMPSLAPPVPTPDISGLGQALLACAPENLANLTLEQRARCPGYARPDENLVIEPPSHVKDPARRAAEMATKNAPMRIPCTSVGGVAAGGGSVAVPMVNPFCLVDGAINGFGPLNGLSK